MNKIILISIILLFFLSVGVVSAAPQNQDVYVAVNGNDTSNTGENANSPYATIAKGVSDVNESKNTKIHLSSGTFTGTGNTGVEINKAHRSQGGSLTILGAGYNKTFIDANSVDRMFDIKADSIVKLINLTLINGKEANGGTITNAGDLNIVDCIFENSYATASGGVIRSSGGNLTISNSIFNNNSAGSSNGGAIYATATTTSISNSSFTNNFATNSGAVALNNGNITNSYFANNYAKTNNGGSISISGSLINNVIINSTVNGTSGKGGAVYLSSGTNYLHNNRMDNCYAVNGNYIHLNSGNVNANVTYPNLTVTKPTGTVTAIVTDDMGYPIYGGTSVRIVFYANNNLLGSSVGANVINGTAIMNYTKMLYNGLYNLNGVSNYFNNLSNVTNGTLTVNINDTVAHHYVSNFGSDDTGDGSQGNPYKTILKAVSEGFLEGCYVTIHLLGETYSGAGNTNINVSTAGVLSIIGEYNKTVIDGGNVNWGFNCGVNTIASISNTTFNNLRGNYGVVYATYDLFVDNCIVDNSNGISASGGKFIVQNSIFTNSSNAISGPATITNCSFVNNLGAIYGNVNVSNSEFINNTRSSGSQGGAIYSQGSVISNNNRYINNSITGGSGSGESYGSGGAINCAGSSGYIYSANDIFIGNSASKYGGAIFFRGNNLTIINCTFINNSAGVNGGAIYNNAPDPNYYLGVVNLTSNTMNNNTAVNNGNDIYLDGSSSITKSNLTFANANIDKISGKITATVADGNGNYVSGGFVNFYLNGKYIGKADLINGLATLIYSGFKNGTYTLSGDHSLAGNYTVNTRNGTVVVVASEVDSVDCYVSKSGSDTTGDGSKTKPFLTIQKALLAGLELSRNITVHVLEGVYSGLGNTNLTLPGTMNIKIIGDGVNKTVIDGESINWIFDISMGEGLITLDGLSIINSKSTTLSPIVIGDANVKILNSYFGNNTGFNGGAINSKGNLTITNTTFNGNKATSNQAGAYGGGAIFNTGTLTINKSSIINNEATTGSGIFNNGNLSIKDSLIEGNSKTTWSNMGSAIYGGNVSVVNCTFTNTTTSAQPGTNYDIGGTAFLEIYNSTFYKSLGIGSFAKIYNSLFTNMTSMYLNGEFYNSTFLNNTMSVGGEFYNSIFNNCTITSSLDTKFYNSIFTKMNRAITVTGGNLLVVGCLFTNNTYAIYGNGANNVTISNSVILNPIQVTASNLTADYNWWGSNSKPVIGATDVNYWIIMTLAPDNKPGLTRNITLAFKSTDGENVYAFDGYLPLREYLFGISNGSISPLSGSLADNLVNAVFNGGSYGNYTVSATIDNQTVDCVFELFQASSSTTVGLSNSTGKLGNKIVVTVEVKDENGDPINEGEVEFFIGDKSIGKVKVVNGKAVMNWTVEGDSGDYDINARYLGSEAYLTSDNYKKFHVTSVKTTTTVGLSNSSAKYADIINITATIRELATNKLVNGGVVKFYVGNKLLGSANVVNGIASFKWLTDLGIGQYNITSVYQGVGDFLDSEAKNTFSQIRYNGTTWNIYNYLSNTQIQYILNNCVNNSNIIFASGQYNKLALTVSKPVNIRGNGTVVIFGGGSGVAFTITGNNVSIRGLIIQNYATGILNRANNVTIINNTFKGNVNGIENYGNGSGVKINANNIFQSNKGSAIYNYGNNLTFRGFKLVNNKIGITNKGLNVDVLSNTISGGEYGIVNNAASADINYNKISNASKYGIQNTGSNTRIRNNTLQNNNYGIYNAGSGSTISSNTMTGGDRGVVNKANTVTITKNTVKSVKTHGIYNTAGSKNKITNNNLTGLNKGYGVYLDKSSKSNVVQGNTITKFSYGVLDAGTSNTVKSNTLKSNNIGVSVSTSAKSTQIASNTITGGSKGIVVNGASVTVSKNTVKSVKSQGIYSNGSKNKITNNNLTGLNKGYGVYLGKKAKSNLVQGNKVNKFSYGILSAGTSNTIKSNTLKSNNIGVSVSASAKSTQVTSNSITGGSKGIVIKANTVTINKNTIKSVKSQGIYSNGSKNKITNNNLTGLNKGYGIYTDKKAKSNQIQGNKITKFSYGILGAGTSNTIKSNTLTSNKIGLSISTSARNTQVTSNKINKNTNYGIYNKGRNTNLYKNTLTSNKYGLATIKSVKNTKNTIKGNKVDIKVIK